MTSLHEKKCAPCSIGTESLRQEEIQCLLEEVPQWQISGDKPRLTREFVLKDFAGALALANRIGALAEEQGHHPDIHIYRWNHVRIELWTHKIRGLSENDFILAAKINTVILN